MSCRSPSCCRSRAIRRLRPIRREISCTRPPGKIPSVRRWCVLRGSIAYSAVSQPCGGVRPCSQRGNSSSMVTLQSTCVWPNLHNTEPSAQRVKCRSKETVRISPGALSGFGVIPLSVRALCRRRHDVDNSAGPGHGCVLELAPVAGGNFLQLGACYATCLQPCGVTGARRPALLYLEPASQVVGGQLALLFMPFHVDLLRLQTAGAQRAF